MPLFNIEFKQKVVSTKSFECVVEAESYEDAQEMVGNNQFKRKLVVKDDIESTELIGKVDIVKQASPENVA